MLRLGPPLPPNVLSRIERRLHLELQKWDTQVGDTSVVSAQPLILSRETWSQLATAAERLARELVSEEQRLLSETERQKYLGVPKAIRDLLARTRPSLPCPMRNLRFDFHPTREGWRISEVNSDVPGGWSEASTLPELFSPHYPRLQLPPSPLSVWGAHAAGCANGGSVALLSAPGFLEDTQVVLSFERELARRSVPSRVVHSPASLLHHRLSLLVRFYQLEWLAWLPRSSGWREVLLRDTSMNPLSAAISESKRCPLAFADLSHDSAWRLYAPESRDPRDLPTGNWDDWVLKRAYSNTGDAVYFWADLPKSARAQLGKAIRRDPESWVAQRPFETLPVSSVRGPLFPCIGVFVVNERAAGAYVRLSPNPVIDAAAVEAPFMIDPDIDGTGPG